MPEPDKHTDEIGKLKFSKTHDALDLVTRIKFDVYELTCVALPAATFNRLHLNRYRAAFEFIPSLEAIRVARDHFDGGPSDSICTDWIKWMRKGRSKAANLSNTGGV